MLVMAVPIGTVSRQSSADALVKLFDDHCPFVDHTFGEPHRDHRVLDGFPMATLTVRKLLSWMWMTSPLWDVKEVTAQQTSPMAHTSSLRLVYRELIVRVIIFTAGSTHEQFHCAERLFQQLLVDKEARVFHDTSPQRIYEVRR